jgi:riboflavin kinase/FMN adenylyltransferase
METYFGFPTQPLDRPAFLTIGNFDGVHRGHQRLVSEMADAAHAGSCLAGLLTFDPHPLAVLRPDVPLSYLTSPEERADLLAALGMDFVLILPFDRATAALTGAEFMRRLVERVPLCAMWIGPDFALGRGREGDANRLRELGQELGYQLYVTPTYDWRGEPVRSSRIRALLAQAGAVDQAADLLGRPYVVWGEVIHGAERGRKLGYPTANLALPGGRLLPAYGIYACWAWQDETGLPAAVNVGVRPSFDNGQLSVEAYLLDFDGDLYGKTLGLSFIGRLRGEQRFADISALVAQMGRDVAAARRILADPPNHASGSWTELVHTADWAIRVEGASQRELFATAASAMFALEDADGTHAIEVARTVNVTAGDAAELLVAWLNALLLGQELDSALYTRFEIFEISATGLRGVAYGYRGAPAHTAIKAVTYYDLSVEGTVETGWEARVTVDV